MGNQLSLPEKVHQAVGKNEPSKLQALLSTNLGPSATPDLRKQVLEQVDKDGRTLLLLACSKNHVEVAKLLIQYGANVHHLNTRKENSGNALHEAASRYRGGTIDDSLIDLLLRHHASPFVANVAGRTAMEDAVLGAHVGLVRKLEAGALFAGTVSVQWTRMAGFAKVFKPRWAVIMLYYPCPKDAGVGSNGQLVVPAVRRQLWIYKDKSCAVPRTRLWLDGGQAFKSGPHGYNGMVRLHTSHVQPTGGVYAFYDRGYQIFVRPENLTAPSVQAYEAFMALCNLVEVPAGPQGPGLLLGPRGSEGSVSSQAGSISGGGARPAAVPVAVVLPPPHYPYPAVPAAAGAMAGPASFSTPSGLRPGYASASAGGAPPAPSSTAGSFDGAGGGGAPGVVCTAPFAVNASPLRDCLGNLNHRRTTSEPGPYPPQAGAGVVGGSFVPSRPQPPDFVDALQALPGESDEEFASRLASAITATSSTTATAAPGAPGAPHSPMPPAMSQVYSQSAPGGAPESSPAPTSASSEAAPRPGSAGHPSAGMAGRGPGPHRFNPNPFEEDLIEGVPSGADDDGDAEPSAPPLQLPPMGPAPPAAAGAAGSITTSGQALAPAGGDVSDDAMCVICLSAPREAGLLHGSSVHKCVCLECARVVNVGMPCPLCRQPIERIIRLYG